MKDPLIITVVLTFVVLTVIGLFHLGLIALWIASHHPSFQ